MSSDSDRRTNELPLPFLAESGEGGGSLVSADDAGSTPGAVRFITDEALYEATGIRLAFTMRHGGVSEAPYASLNLGPRTPDDPEKVAENRRIVLDALGLGRHAGRLVNPIQVHSDGVCAVLPHAALEEFSRDVAVCGMEDVHAIESPLQPVLSEEADCVVSGVPDVPVMMLYADCVPVVIVAPDGSFAVVHSGWRGTIKSIARKAVMVLSMVSDYPGEAMNAYIGPHIGPCCYEVSDDLMDTFVAEFGLGCDAFSNHLDLGYAVVSALSAAGIDHARIADAGICTSHSTADFYSHRAENGTTGRFAAICCRTR